MPPFLSCRSNALWKPLGVDSVTTFVRVYSEMMLMAGQVG